MRLKLNRHILLISLGLSTGVMPARGQLFTQITTPLPAVSNASVIWGDFNSDGRLDIVVTGDTGTSKISQIYNGNGAGVFTLNASAGLKGVYYGAVAGGDYDNDGDLDLILTGAPSLTEVMSSVYRNNGNGTFTDIVAGLTGVRASSVAWGDCDNDGRSDLLLTGSAGGTTIISRIYRNTSTGTFVDINAAITGVRDGSGRWGDYNNDGARDFVLTGYPGTPSVYVGRVYKNSGSNTFSDLNAGLLSVGYGSSSAWGDYDNDGDMDLYVTGVAGTNYLSRLYRNNLGSFTALDVGLPGAMFSSSSWGDFDNDGDLDLLLSGRATGNVSFCRVYRNNGNGTFTDVNAGLPGIDNGTAAWGDYDNDGDLDIVLAGKGMCRVYRNNSTVINTKPLPPTQLSTTVVGNTVTLGWNAGSDTKTPAAGLTYNVRVGSTPGAGNIVSPESNSTGFKYIPGPGNAQSAKLFKLTVPLGVPIYWSVQAVDSAFAGSAFSMEASFRLNVVATPVTGTVGGDTNCNTIVYLPSGVGVNSLSTGSVPDRQIAKAGLGDSGSISRDFAEVTRDFWVQNTSPKATDLVALSQTEFLIGLTNASAWNLSVLSSTNLVDWETLGLAVPVYRFSDPAAADNQPRFYRLTYP